MTDDGRTALIRIWGLCGYLIAILVVAVSSTIVDGIWPSLSAETESEQHSARWTAFVSVLMVAALLYVFVRYVWRPYWTLDRMALVKGTKWRLIGAMAHCAIWPGLVMGLLLTPIGLPPESRWAILLFLPALFALNWFEKQGPKVVDRAVAIAGMTI